ncbi:LOW QUALITY PROTEIN: hypothetical protein CFC21_014245 [Triticum aestivum]|uniref:RBR-type E3 ubiquitin transferase n=2 Tax=Triticum aestivum TaxID=4565 RepID=A0A3B6A425_WHEAT|nr:LOW QUALITY PROTEIN: hypothetical protein CFC21_014245 [Triticum aestivum]
MGRPPPTHSNASAVEDAPVETPPPRPEAPATPVEASSSGTAAVGGGPEEEDLRRLHELVGFGRERVELTEEEVRANHQRQEDEICALEAIFGDNLVMFSRKEGQRSFQVHVHIEIPEDGKDVSVRLSFGTGALDYKQVHGHDGDASDELFYKFRVQHLPSILLSCLLPSSYPSHQPPFFTISTEWLDRVMISSLCHMLDMTWEEQRGMEVIYQWVQRLQSSSLSYLGFDDEIILRKADQTYAQDGGDKRALTYNAPPDVTIPRIIRYNDDKRHEAFLYAIHYCTICFSEFPGVDFIKLPCHHFFCQKCMQTYCKMHVKEGTVVKLLCPDTKCGAVVPPNILKRLLGEDEFERWETLLLQRTLDAMVDVVYCPRCQTACLEDAGDEAVCPSCLFSFCALCRERRHVGVECLSAEEKIQILEERQKSARTKGDIQKLMDEVCTIKEILKDAKQCPHCKMAISKIEGCNKMTCWNCGRFFCYQCSAAISGYDHFNGDCVIFDEAEIDRWQMPMNRRLHRMVVGQAQVALLARGHAYPCPTCGQAIRKIGNNNHLYCWSCNQHCCALCRTSVQKMSQHFGPTGCKQHTENP